MLTAQEIMNPEPFLTSPETKVGALAKQLFEGKVDGACVMNDKELVGVVTSMDLVYQEKSIHVPAVINIMDVIIPLSSPGRTRKELEKITGSKVSEIMSASPITVSPETTLEKIATLMVEKHITLLPVLDNDRLVGCITKPDVLRAVFHFHSEDR